MFRLQMEDAALVLADKVKQRTAGGYRNREDEEVGMFARVSQSSAPGGHCAPLLSKCGIDFGMTFML
jgi:hypothetical protein